MTTTDQNIYAAMTDSALGTQLRLAAIERRTKASRDALMREAARRLEARTMAARETQPLTQLPFTPEDHDKSDRIAAALGYAQTAYTSTSALWGLFCLPENPATARPGERTTGGCIIKTRELGFLFVVDGEDVGLGYDWADVDDER